MKKLLTILILTLLIGCEKETFLEGPDKEYFYGQWTDNPITAEVVFEFVEDTTSVYDNVMWSGTENVVIVNNTPITITLVYGWSLGRIDGIPTIIIQSHPSYKLPILEVYDNYFVTDKGIFWKLN